MASRIMHFFTEGFPPRDQFPRGFRGLFRYWAALMTAMPPGMRRIMMFQPILALATGLACMVLLRRGFDHAPVAILFFAGAFAYIAYRVYRPAPDSRMALVWDMALIYLLNDLLFFVLPFYFESMTLWSRTLLFVPLVAALALVTNWYQLYQRIVVRSPLASALFYSLIFFCVLNILFPILFGMRNIWSLLVSGAVASAAAVLFVYPHLSLLKSGRNTALFLAGIVIFYAALWFGRSIIPPAPLRLMTATPCLSVDRFEPVAAFAVADANLAEVYFYSRIFAPRGLAEQIDHVWYHNGRRLLSIRLSEIHGGHRAGYATWSRRPVMEGPGRYTVEVWTAGGQLLGARNFMLH